MTSSNRLEAIPLDGHSAYYVEFANLSGSGRSEIVAACHDGTVLALDDEGRIIWRNTIGCFPYDLCVYDLTGDGLDELLLAGTDGGLYCFGAEGRLLWRFATDGPLFQATAGRLDGTEPLALTGGADLHVYALAADGTLRRKVKTPQVHVTFSSDGITCDCHGAVQHLRAYGIQGANRDRVALTSMPGGGNSSLFVLEGPELEPALQKRVDPYGIGHWHPMSLKVDDLDEDGKAEFIYAARRWTAVRGRPVHDGMGILTHDGETACTSEVPEWQEVTYDHFFRMSLLETGYLPGRGDKVVFELAGAELAIYDRTLKRITRALAPVAFTAIASDGNRNGSTLLLGSSPNGDDTIYRLRLEDGWAEEFRSIARRGRIDRIGRNLDRLHRQVLAAPTEPGPDTGTPPKPYIVEVSGALLQKNTLGQLSHYIAHNQWVQSQFPYDNLKLATVFWLSEKGCEKAPDGHDWGVDPRMDYQLNRSELVGIAERLEAEGVPFIVQDGHGNCAFLRLETVEQMLRAAPTCLLGFMSSEMHTAAWDSFRYYVKNHIEPEMELCRKYGGKKVIMRGKGLYWVMIPAMKEISDLLFNGRYRDVMVPLVEDSNSRTPELSLAGRVGLWLSGLVDTWGTKVNADSFRSNSYLREWHGVHCGHPFIRTLIAHASLGASMFMMRQGGDNGYGSHRFKPFDEPFRWTVVGEESEVPFLHMLGRGIVRPPSREQISVSNLVIGMDRPSERFRKHGSNSLRYQVFEKEDEEDGYAFSKLDCYYGMSPTCRTDITYDLFGKRRQAGYFVPPTPYGFIPVVPNAALTDDSRGFQKVVTDGDCILDGGRKRKYADLRDGILAQAAECAADLPFVLKRGDAVFMQANRIGDGRYRLYLVDHGYVDPQDRTVRVKAAKLDGRLSVYDVLSGDQLPVADRAFSAEVKAGTYRILDAHVEPDHGKGG